MGKSKFVKISLFFFVFFSSLNAQQSSVDKLVVKTESAGVFTTGDNAPFWLTNNKYGIGWHTQNNQYIRAGIFADKDISNVKVSVGGDAIIANQLESDIFVQQLYLDLNYKKVGLSLGQKERSMLFRNNELSTGSMVFSNNTRPIPQAEFSTLEFIPIPYSKETLSFMGGMSYGWYTDNKYRQKADSGTYVRNALYHYKYLYMKFEKSDLPWNLIFGVEGATQWGGDRYNKNEFRSSSPRSFKDMLKIFFNQSGGSKANEGEQINKLGESYGSYHLIFNYGLKNNSHIKLYYEHFFDDRSGMEFMNFPDGTYGVEYNFNKKQLISTILFEYIYAKSQSGAPEYDENGKQIHISTADDYYNNFYYMSNQHHGFVMGNPLLISPLYNKGTSLKILNNRLISYHLGLKGWFSDNLSYKILATHSRGYGTPFLKFDKPRNEFMSSFELFYSNPKLDGWLFSGALAYDNSDFLLGDNLGVQIKLSKTFNIR